MIKRNPERSEANKNRPLGLCKTAIHYPQGGIKWHYPWCKTAYRKWIDAKIKELREADGK